jgi:hypothetical protein
MQRAHRRLAANVWPIGCSAKNQRSAVNDWPSETPVSRAFLPFADKICESRKSQLSLSCGFLRLRTAPKGL